MDAIEPSCAKLVSVASPEAWTRCVSQYPVSGGLIGERSVWDTGTDASLCAVLAILLISQRLVTHLCLYLTAAPPDASPAAACR